MGKKFLNILILFLGPLFILGCPKDPRATPSSGGDIASLVISDGQTTAAEYFNYDFGSVFPNQTKDATFTVSNKGTLKATELVYSDLPATVTYTGGNFPGTNGTCATELTAGGSCTLQLTFSPVEGTTLNGNYTIQYSSNLNESKSFTSTLHLSGQDGSVNAPQIDSVSPVYGSIYGGTVITLSGPYFASSSTVKVGGGTCTGVTVSANKTLLTCTSPSHASGLVNIAVTSSYNLVGTLAQIFSYHEVPVVTAVSKSAGALAGGTSLTLTGTYFVAGASVSIGGSSCGSVNVVSSTQITCVTGNNTAGTKNIVVTNADGFSGSLANAYTYQAAPTVTSVSVSAGALSGSTALTITGTGFLTGATVLIGGSSATSIVVNSATSISCVTPSHSAGTVSIVVTNTDSQSGTGSNLYTYQAAPTVTSVSPTAGALAGGTSITITGTGFVTGATVSVGGNTCSSPSVTNSTTMTCTTAAHSAGTTSIVVTNADTQSGTGTNLYTYQAAPTVTSVSPTAGALAGGSTLTITGTGFLTGATATVGGSTCTSPTVVSSTSLTCTLPAKSAGAYAVAVTNSDTQSGSLSSAYTYQAAPNVTSVSPASGTISGSTSITLTGTGFISGATVSIGGTTCTSPSVSNATTMTCTTPAITSGYGGAMDVTVTNTDTQTGTLSNGYFYDQEKWANMSTTGAPSGRTAQGIWTGSKFIIWGGSNGSALNSGGQYDPILDSWTTLETTGAPSARAFAAGAPSLVWTGSKLVVWGGGASALNTGGLYDPVANTWITMTTTGAPLARFRHTGTYAGDKVVFWGGLDASINYLNTGGVYDPINNNWTVMATTGAPAGRQYSPLVGFDTRVFVFGGSGASIYGTGGVYNVTTNTWSSTSTTGSPGGRSFHQSLFANGRIIVWGGFTGGTAVLNTGGIYDPNADSWTTIATTAAPSPRQNLSAVFTGSKMIVWGGDNSAGTTYNNGGLYDINSNSWSSMTSVGVSYAQSSMPAAFTGGKMLLFGGFTSGYVNTGFVYTPPADSASNTWTAMTTTGAPSIRSTNGIWTGSNLLVWGGGGAGGVGARRNTGGLYDPITNSWTATNTTGAPVACSPNVVVWTGSKMLVWGGSDYNNANLNSGALSNPVANSWTTISTTSTLSPRYNASAVWSGTKLYVWGGTTNEGAYYDVGSDHWTPMTTTGTLSVRSSNTIVWTGSKLMVWSGISGNTYYGDGAIYDPSNDSWSSMSTTGRAPARSGGQAFMYGSKVLIWGGYAGGITNTGGIYNPNANSWSSTMTTNAPSPRYMEAIVWTGSRMLVWAGNYGINGSSNYNTGGIYEPASNSWTTLATTNAPSPRWGMGYAWTGGKLLIWGGFDNNGNYLNTGGIYTP